MASYALDADLKDNARNSEAMNNTATTSSKPMRIPGPEHPITIEPNTTYCPYTGECSYFSIPLGGQRSTNAVWTYEFPYPAVASIREHLAFYSDRVDIIAE